MNCEENSVDDDNPSIISHVSVGSNKLARSLAFYDRVLATLSDEPGASP